LAFAERDDADRATSNARLKHTNLDAAQCHFVFVAHPEPEQGCGFGRRTRPENTAYSVIIAAHTLWLAVRAVGLGLGWVSILDPVTVGAALEVPAGWTFIGYFCLGYPQAEHEVQELERLGWERRRFPGSVLVRR
jgi:5,6-dimethylbenzimidazole synthase